MHTGRDARTRLVLSMSSTQKAALNRVGFMPGAFPSPEVQEEYAREWEARLLAAERGDPYPQDRWVLEEP